MRTFIRVDCDYYAEGLWDERGRMIYVHSLPMSDGLKQRLLAWQKKYDEEAEPWENGFDWDAHRAEGIAIARLVKEELPPCEVVARDRRVNDDGSLGDRVPFPGDHLLKD